MKQLTEILPDVFVVEVQVDAFGFDIQNYTTEQELIYMIELRNELDETLVTVKLSLAKDWKILGTITKDEISFDVSGLVEFKKYKHENCINKCASYPSECLCKMQNKYLSQQSFRSLLLKHGLFWESETINIPKRDYKMFPGGKKAAQRFNEEYQQNEANKLTGKLVVLKKVK